MTDPEHAAAPGWRTEGEAKDQVDAGSVLPIVPPAALKSGRNARSPLTATLRTAMAEDGASMADLTVLAPGNDPFRVDTPARHRDAAWLGERFAEMNGRVRHLRGLHYALIGTVKPDGKPYINTDQAWTWLARAAKAARWLGYVPFDQLEDQRNAAPVIRPFVEQNPQPYLSFSLDVSLPDLEDLEPRVWVQRFQGRQPFKMAIYGEKSSLEPVLGPLAEKYGADLFLPSGELSETQAFLMAKAANEDGRPLVLFSFSDCDPSGWQMPVSIARKLQALKAFAFPNLEFEVHRVALTPDHVRAYGLPSTPLKDTERRADKWVQAMGVEQTEIDALATLRPELLTALAEEVIAPFHDSTLDTRVRDAWMDWLDEAQAMLAGQVDADMLDNVRAAAALKLTEMQAEIDALNEAMQVAVAEEIRTPPVVVPTAVVDATCSAMPLVDSSWTFAEQCRALIASKAYGEGGSA